MEKSDKRSDKRMEKLNDLIAICKDGRRGFWQAASEVDSKSSMDLLRKQAFQRTAFAIDLHDSALKLGIRPPAEGSVLGKLHRVWMNFRHHLNPHKDEVVLLECKRGEEYALKTYTEVFENHLLPDIEPLLEKQFVSMVEMRDELTAMTKPEKQSESMLRLL